MDRRGNHFLGGADRSVIDRPPMAAEKDTSTHVTESEAEVSVKLPSVPGFAPSSCTSSSTDGASGSRAARLSFPRLRMPARSWAKSVRSVLAMSGSTLYLPRPEARLVSLGTGRAGRLGTQSAEAAAARGVRSARP